MVADKFLCVRCHAYDTRGNVHMNIFSFREQAEGTDYLRDTIYSLDSDAALLKRLPPGVIPYE